MTQRVPVARVWGCEAHNYGLGCCSSDGSVAALGSGIVDSWAVAEVDEEGSVGSTEDEAELDSGTALSVVVVVAEGVVVSDGALEEGRVAAVFSGRATCRTLGAGEAVCVNVTVSVAVDAGAATCWLPPTNEGRPNTARYAAAEPTITTRATIATYAAYLPGSPCCAGICSAISSEPCGSNTLLPPDVARDFRTINLL